MVFNRVKLAEAFNIKLSPERNDLCIGLDAVDMKSVDLKVIKQQIKLLQGKELEEVLLSKKELLKISEKINYFLNDGTTTVAISRFAGNFFSTPSQQAAECKTEIDALIIKEKILESLSPQERLMYELASKKVLNPKVDEEAGIAGAPKAGALEGKVDVSRIRLDTPTVRVRLLEVLSDLAEEGESEGVLVNILEVIDAIKIQEGVPEEFIGKLIHIKTRVAANIGKVPEEKQDDVINALLKESDGRRALVETIAALPKGKVSSVITKLLQKEDRDLDDLLKTPEGRRALEESFLDIKDRITGADRCKIGYTLIDNGCDITRLGLQKPSIEDLIGDIFASAPSKSLAR